MLRLLFITVLLWPALLLADAIRVGPGEAIERIADAARIARDGDVVVIAPGEYRGDVTVWRQKRLTIRGEGEGPVLIAGGKSAEGKAIWVVRDGDFLIENIEFRGARVRGGNGAGVRFERGRLEIRNCRFIDNQNGLLTGNFEEAELVVRDSVFATAPHRAENLPHLLYVGRIGRFELTGSRFHEGYEGHLVKSRARVNVVRYNLIYDGPNGRASYELEFPNGGIADVVGNVIGQGAATSNPTVVAYGAEGYIWDENALRLSHNTLVSERTLGALFLRVWNHELPSPVAIQVLNNLTVGPGVFSMGANGHFAGNLPAFFAMLSAPDILDFTVGESSLLRGRIDPLDPGHPLRPDAEFMLPVGTRPLVAPRRWAPGAFQSYDW